MSEKPKGWELDAELDAWPPVECLTHNRKAQKAVADFVERMKQDLPCGHALGDLVWAPGCVTKCGACLADRKRASSVSPGASDSSSGDKAALAEPQERRAP